MASITRESNGRKTIQFVGADGKRRSLRLGKCGIKTAEAVKVHVEQLVASTITGHAVPIDTAHWLTERDKVLLDKLAAVGLTKHQKHAPVLLAVFLSDYLAKRTDIKPSTRRHLEQARQKLVGFFGADKLLVEITPGDADEFRLHLLEGLGDNTTRRMCGRAKQFFRTALRKRLIGENPFGDMKGCSVQANRSRDYFILPEDAQRVLDACPDAQWRLLFALSRYGGLRCPSEHLSLRWGDIDWGKGRICVHSPKTEHHQGGESRLIPIFPELRPYLEQVWEQAEPGTEYVITRYRTANANLRTQLMKIVRRAGLEPWPKMFHNLRATRQTELEESFPSHVVNAWIGNSRSVAEKHYLQVTDAHFAKAQEASPADAVHFPVQQTAEMTGTGSPSESSPNEKTPVLQGSATACGHLPNGLVPPLGLEPRTY